MKLLYCPSCGDILRMRPALRWCACGKHGGRYVDPANVVQTEGSISIALHNQDLKEALDAFAAAPTAWHPLFTFRAYLNPHCEKDVHYVVPPEPSEETQESAPEERTAEMHPEGAGVDGAAPAGQGGTPGGPTMETSVTLEAVREALAPIARAVASLDLGDPAAAQRTLAERFPMSSLGAVREIVLAANTAGLLTPRRATETLTFGRVSKPAPELGDCSIDAVDMVGQGAPHTHPNGEVSLCFAVEGDPRFMGEPEGFVVAAAGSTHTPEVTGGRMVIVYFLPQGAMIWK